MKRTKLGIGLLVMLALVVTSGTFAYWVSSVTGPADDSTVGTVSIGEGGTVTTQYVITGDDPQSTGLLVPSGFEDNVTTFASRTISWDIAWDAIEGGLAGTTSTADITVTVTWEAKDSLGTVVANSAGTVTTYTGAITVTPNGANPTSMTLDAAASTFSFDVTMGEPSSSAQYDLIANGSIVVTVTYSISNINTTDN